MKSTYKHLKQYLSENHSFSEVSEEFLEQTAPLIGYIVHSFNLLEEQLNSSICELINDRSDEPGAIIILKMNFASKIDLFNRQVTALQLGLEKQMPSFSSFIEDLKQCNSLRNTVVHAEWENMDDQGYTYVKMDFDKKGIKQQYMQFTPEALKEIETFINDTYMKFEQYMDEKNQIFCS